MFFKMFSEKKSLATIFHPHQQPCLKHVVSPDLGQTLARNTGFRILLVEDPEVNKDFLEGASISLKMPKLA